MDAYYVELARDSLNKAVNELRHAEQYAVQAGELDSLVSQISKIISSVENRNKDLGYWLKTGVAVYKE